MAKADLSTSDAPPSPFKYRSTAEEVTRGVDLTGRVVIVTGANTGLGEETARVLALRGATLVLAVRNTEAGEKVKSRILGEVGGAKEQRQGDGNSPTQPSARDADDGLDKRFYVLPLDLSKRASVRKFADAFLSLNIPLHILINNAGIMMCPFSLSEDGYELQLATNHLGHFLLTELLLPKLKESAKESGQESRIVVSSSCLHEKPYPKVGIRFDALNDPKGYNQDHAYGQSKLANVLHARELARRLKDEGANVTVNALHPGVILTSLTRHVLPKGSLARGVFLGIHALAFRFFWKTIPQGAATQCYAAAHPSMAGVSGKYLQDSRVAEEAASPFTHDQEMARKVWELSEKFAAE